MEAFFPILGKNLWSSFPLKVILETPFPCLSNGVLNQMILHVITFRPKISLSLALPSLVLFCSVLIMPEAGKSQEIDREVKYEHGIGWEVSRRRRAEHLIISWSCECFHSTLLSSVVLFPATACFVGHILAVHSVSLLWKPAKNTLLTTCSLS